MRSPSSVEKIDRYKIQVAIGIGIKIVILKKCSTKLLIFDLENLNGLKIVLKIQKSYVGFGVLNYLRVDKLF